MIKNSSKSRGFSLIEMLVAMAILAIVSLIVIAGYGKMNNQLATSNLAYDIALVFRQAQVYSSASKGTFVLHNTADNLSGRESYGVRFARFYDKTKSELASDKFILFSESSGSNSRNTLFRCGTGAYSSNVAQDLKECEASDEYDSTYSISGRSRIKSFCVYRGATSYCQNFSGQNAIQYAIQYVDTVFYGPFVSAKINTDIDDNYDYLEITVISASEDYERKILVYKTGQINVTN